MLGTTDLLLILLIGLLLLVLGGIIFIVIQLRREIELPAGYVENAVSRSWLKLGLDTRVGQIASYAQDIRDDYRQLDQMLRVPSQRGALGELALETILLDQLDPSMVGIRVKLPNGFIPDAHIRSTVGLICIDSKFALDNFRHMLNATEPARKQAYRKAFLQNVRQHLNKIKQDYVRPQEGTAPFALAYIPAEGVYWFLVTEALDMLRAYSKEGVQVVSPLTLSHKIELIKAGVQDQKLSEEARQIKHNLHQLGQQFAAMDETWRIFHDTHVRNMTSKAETLRRDYQKLREQFAAIYDL